MSLIQKFEVEHNTLLRFTVKKIQKQMSIVHHWLYQSLQNTTYILKLNRQFGLSAIENVPFQIKISALEETKRLYPLPNMALNAILGYGIFNNAILFFLPFQNVHGLTGRLNEIK